MLRITLIIGALFALVLAAWFGRNIACQEQLQLYGSLKSVSSIIFGVMGAWIAILYPKGLKSIFSLTSSLDENYARVRRLIFPTRCAASVIVVSLCFEFSLPAVRQIQALVKHTILLRAGSFCLVVSLLILLIIGLLRTFSNLEETNEQAKQQINEDEVKRRVRNQVKTAPPPK